MDFPGIARVSDARSQPSRRPIAVACALIERDGRLLVAQRPPGKALALKWEFPGGKIERGETAAAALVRELREELGLEVEVGRELASVTHDYGDVFITLVPFRCTPTGAEPHPREHVEARWCTPDEIDALDLADADRPVLAAWRADRGRSG
jgi:8-oxo-dGTP diphosphatase